MLHAGGDDGDAFAGFDESEDAGPGGGCVDDVWREAFCRAERDDAVEEEWCGLAVGDEEAFFAQGAHVDGLAGEAMVGTHDDQDGVAVEELGAQDAVEGRLQRAGKADVDAAIFEGEDLLGRVHFNERKLDARASEAELADDAREKTACAPEEKADVERTDFAMERLSGEVDGAFGGFEGFASVLEEDLAFRGEANGAAGAVEEDAADFAFEVKHLFADRGLRDVELSSRGGEASAVGDCREITEVTQFHGIQFIAVTAF